MGPWAPFFTTIFGPFAAGYVCITAIQMGTPGAKERFFRWPDQTEEISEYIGKYVDSKGVNLYYCPQLFKDPNFRRETEADGKRGNSARVKENVGLCPTVWADLDTCTPDLLLVQPSVVIESSPGRFQTLWILDEPLTPEMAEELSRRVAYHHIQDGADKSGWDLTQLLRIPGTKNYKYELAPEVALIEVNNRLVRVDDFIPYPAASRRTGGGIPMPDPEELPVIDNPVEFMQEKRRTLNSDVFRLFSDKPAEGKWSEALWKYMMLLFEGGLDREEVFVLSQQAGCNKYDRDGKSIRHLWDDVCRAYIKHMENVKAVVVPELEQIDLLTSKEIERVRERFTFVERYITWATSLGDAAPQYHQAGAFVILSALMGGRVSLPTSFGNITPNLWFMILADTTLTRKSTAMDIAMDLLAEVDSDIIMATDGSLEGLLQGLSLRPGKSSIFLRDEFTGLLESMTKKDYMAGMAEMFTKLYDGKMQKRLLRKDIVEIKDPVLILFAGGIRSRTQQLLTLDHISSGFMPRFIFLTAESDVSKVKPLGPPVIRDMTARDALFDEIRQLYEHYSQKVNINVQGAGIALAPPRKWKAKLSDEAWIRYGKFEKALLDAGMKSDRPDLMTPVYARLGVSTLKAALLIAASETEDDEIIISELDIIHAISFATKWREYAIDIINGVGTTQSERDIQKVLGSIVKNPGVSRSQIMQSHHLTARNADELFRTLEQRGLVTSNRYGKGTTYHPLGSSND